MEELKILYNYRKPYAIRDKTGCLLFFSKIHKYTGQEERYQKEIEEQLRVAEYIKTCLESYK